MSLSEEHENALLSCSPCQYMLNTSASSGLFRRSCSSPACYSSTGLPPQNSAAAQTLSLQGCCATHFRVLLPFRVAIGCCAAPKAPTPPKSPGELAGSAPDRLLPLLAKMKGGADAEPATGPPNRLCPVLTGGMAGCGAPSARGALCFAGALCAATWCSVSSTSQGDFASSVSPYCLWTVVISSRLQTVLQAHLLYGIFTASAAAGSRT
jgi:hypothetical protein